MSARSKLPLKRAPNNQKATMPLLTNKSQLLSLSCKNRQWTRSPFSVRMRWATPITNQAQISKRSLNSPVETMASNIKCELVRLPLSFTILILILMQIAMFSRRDHRLSNFCVKAKTKILTKIILLRLRVIRSCRFKWIKSKILKNLAIQAKLS